MANVPLVYNKLTNNEYESLVYDVLLDQETEDDTPETTPYGDGAGIATIGIGFNLKTPYKSNKSSLSEVLNQLGIVYNNTDMLSPNDVKQEISYISQISTYTHMVWNDDTTPGLIQDIDSVLQQRSQQSYMPILYPNGSPPLSLTLDETQIDNAYEAIKKTQEGILSKDLPGIPDSLERIALLSLVYNNPDLIGQNLTTAIQDGDRSDAWYEIRYDSNAGKKGPQKGVAVLRDYESAIFGLYNNPSSVSLQEAEQVYFTISKNYDAIFPQGSQTLADKEVGDANAKYAYSLSAIDQIDPQVTIQTAAQSLAPAQAQLVNAYGNGQQFQAQDIYVAENSTYLVLLGTDNSLYIATDPNPNEPQGTGVSLNDGNDTIYADCFVEFSEGKGNNTFTLPTSSGAYIDNFGGISQANDVVTLLGHSIATTIENDTTDQYGRTYEYHPAEDGSVGSLDIYADSTNVLSIDGFAEGDFGVTVTNPQNAVPLTPAQAAAELKLHTQLALMTQAMATYSSDAGSLHTQSALLSSSDPALHAIVAPALHG